MQFSHVHNDYAWTRYVLIKITKQQRVLVDIIGFYCSVLKISTSHFHDFILIVNERSCLTGSFYTTKWLLITMSEFLPASRFTCIAVFLFITSDLAPEVALYFRLCLLPRARHILMISRLQVSVSNKLCMRSKFVLNLTIFFPTFGVFVLVGRCKICK